MKKLKVSELRNQMTLECMIDLKNEIVELQKKQKSLDDEYDIMIEKHNGNDRKKEVRESLYKIRDNQYYIKIRKDKISELFMSYKNINNE